MNDCSPILSVCQQLVSDIGFFRKKNMLDLFKEHDKDSSGQVSQEEACQVLVKLLPDFEEEKSKTVLKKFDTDGSGKLNYEEFCFFYASVKLR